MSPTAASGRIHVPLLVLALVAVAAVAVVLLADPFGIMGGIDRQQGEGYLPEELDPLAGLEGEGEGDRRSVSLAGRYGAGDLGALRMRLLHVEDRRPLADQPLTLSARSGDSQQEVSGVDGVVVFGELLPGRGYSLAIAGEGHVPVTIQGIRINRGETNDLGDIILGQHVVLRGRVVDGTGRPLPGSSVAVYTAQGSMIADGFLTGMIKSATTFPEPLERVSSDDEGWFMLSTLDDGVYRMEVRHEGYATRYESDVVVAKDRPAKELRVILGEGATVRGSVRDERGQPVANARVVAIKDAGRRFGGGGTLERDIGFTDSGGKYAIDTLTQGTTYRFGVMAEGYAPVFEMTGEEIRGKAHEKDFSLVLGGAISGVVRRQSDGKPVESALVVVAVGRMPFGPGRGRGGNEGGEPPRTSTGQVRTDADGRFLLENLAPGPVLSGQIKAPGYVPFTANQWMGSGWGEVVPGETLDVSVDLEEGGVIEGTIFDAGTREPIADAEVTVIARQNAWMMFVSGAPSARTDGAGKYVLSGVKPGEYGVTAVADGYAAADSSADANAVKLTEVGGAVSCDVGLNRAGWVKGVVLDSIGEPVAGARVRTRMAPEPRGEGGRRGGRGSGRMRSFLPGGSGADITDQDGSFVIENVSSDARWILVADADEFVQVESDAFQVRAGEEKEVDLVLVGGGSLEGRVVDDRGAFVKGARIQVGHIPADRAGRGRMNAWEVDRYLEPGVYFSDENGRFLATNIPPGIGLVKAELEGYVTYYKRGVMIRSDETTSDYLVAMTKGDVLRGIVKSANGQPVEGAMVAVTKNSMDDSETEEDESEEIEPRMSGRSDATGRFEIENVPPGMYNVVVWFAPGHLGWARNQSENAMRRGVSSDARDVEFRLEVQTQSAGPGRPGGR